MIALMLITSIPGLVPLLILIAAIDRMGLVANRRLRLPWRKDESGRPMAAPGVDELFSVYRTVG
jgi:Na+-transporting methylmalonyl-CoA/oxaloacetate decarboxylase gamma subunit